MVISFESVDEVLADLSTSQIDVVLQVLVQPVGLGDHKASGQKNHPDLYFELQSLRQLLLGLFVLAGVVLREAEGVKPFD